MTAPIIGATRLEHLEDALAAVELELSVEEVLDGMQALHALGSVSLDAPRGGDADDDGGSFADAIGFEDSGFELVELGADVSAALRQLEPRQREILRMRFFEELTQSQIAERLDISQMHVSRLLAKSLRRLRERAEETGLLH